MTLLARSLDHLVVRRPSRARAHGVALLCVALATFARMALDPFVANVVPFATFYPAILIATLAGGVWAGLSAWVMSSVAVWYFIFPPHFSFNRLSFSEVTSLALFALTSLPVVGVAHRLRRVVVDLHHSEERFRTLVEAMPKLVWTAGPDGACDYFNRQWIAFTGASADRHFGDGWMEVVHPEDRERVAAAWRAAVREQREYDLEYRLRRHDGLYCWFKVRGLPIRDAAGRLNRWIGSSTEITEIQEARQALARSRDDLERLVAERTRELAESNRLLIAEIAERERAEAALARAQRLEAIGQLTGGVAHDFNNLLTVIVGSLDMVERAADDPQRVRRLAAAALAAAGRGERLTQQLLAFARRQPLRPEVIGVNRLLRELEPLARRAVGEAVEVRLELDDGLHPCRVDPSQFESAVLNLVVNARDATPAGGRITVSTRGVTVPGAAAADPVPADLADGDWVMVAVRDTGSGIPPDVLPRVFDPFFTTKDVGKGSGLGLSQVYGFVSQSGGQVRIDSPAGGGTIVQVWLPAAIGAQEPAEAPRPTADAYGMRGHGETVLVVEDDPDVREVSVETLHGLGYRVMTATDGVEALEVLAGGEAIDLLFTDVVMPRGVNGADLARRAQELRPGLRVLLTSGYTAQALTSEHGVVHGFPLLRKPYRGAELARAVREALGAPALPAAEAAGPLRIFVVEDDELIRLSALELLADMGAEVVGEAADAETALASIEGGAAVDVLLTDMRLPGMSGAELIHALRRRHPDLSVVLATGYGDAVEGFDATAPGNAILAKPYGVAELRNAITRLHARAAAA